MPHACFFVFFYPSNNISKDIDAGKGIWLRPGTLSDTMRPGCLMEPLTQSCGLAFKQTQGGDAGFSSQLNRTTGLHSNQWTRTRTHYNDSLSVMCGLACLHILRTRQQSIVYSCWVIATKPKLMRGLQSFGEILSRLFVRGSSFKPCLMERSLLLSDWETNSHG